MRVLVGRRTGASRGGAGGGTEKQEEGADGRKEAEEEREAWRRAVAKGEHDITALACSPSATKTIHMQVRISKQQATPHTSPHRQTASESEAGGLTAPMPLYPGSDEAVWLSALRRH